MPRDQTLHHLQHRRDQLGLRGQQQPQRDRQRQYPLAHRHVRDDAVDQMRCRLRQAVTHEEREPAQGQRVAQRLEARQREGQVLRIEFGARQPLGLDDVERQRLVVGRGGGERGVVGQAQIALEPDEGAGRHGRDARASPAIAPLPGNAGLCYSGAERGRPRAGRLGRCSGRRLGRWLSRPTAAAWHARAGARPSRARRGGLPCSPATTRASPESRPRSARS